MKKLFLLSMVVVFVLVGAQAFASPPIKPPVEGFVITSTTDILVDGTMTESERYNWTYYEGWGTGPFYPAGYDPMNCGGRRCPNDDPTSPYYGNIVNELGFSEGAEIAYEQKFTAKNGTQTSFFKTFAAYSNPDAAALQDNLVVHKEITYKGNAAGDIATHSEKVGLSVISMGAASSAAGSPASGLLSLCPWAADGGGSAGGGYPPTNEGIAAGSSFKVSEITNFVSDSRVNSTANPMLSYNVDAPSGKGFIDAGFVVELYEGPEGYVWKPVLATQYGLVRNNGGPLCVGCPATPQSTHIDADGNVVTNDCYILPQAFGAPPLASRTSYKEYASADGTWSFSKHVKYESKMPAGASASTFPINQVLVP